MEITAYQVLTPLVALIAISYAWNLVYRQQKTLWEALLWTLFWGVIAVVALLPDLLGYLTSLTGVKDRENAIFITSIGILFFVMFYVILRLEKLEQRQTSIVRKIALQQAGLPEEK